EPATLSARRVATVAPPERRSSVGPLLFLAGVTVATGLVAAAYFGGYIPRDGRGKPADQAAQPGQSPAANDAEIVAAAGNPTASKSTFRGTPADGGDKAAGRKGPLTRAADATTAPPAKE